MADIKIDYNRGVHKQKTPEGIEVYMFLDEPGVYYSAQMLPVTEELASTAGFPVEKWRKLRLKKERQMAFNQALEEELALDDLKTRKTHKERNGWVIVTTGLGRYYIEDPEGIVVSNRTLTKDEAEKVFDKLVPKEATPTKKVLSEEKAAAH